MFIQFVLILRYSAKFLFFAMISIDKDKNMRKKIVPPLFQKHNDENQDIPFSCIFYWYCTLQLQNVDLFIGVFTFNIYILWGLMCKCIKAEPNKII